MTKKTSGFWPSLLTTCLIMLVVFLLVTVILYLTGRPSASFYSSLRLVITGIDASKAIGSSGWLNLRYPGEWIVTAVPLILTALSMGFAFHNGLWNIGAEGQYIIGMSCSTLAALLLPALPVVHVLLCVVCGIFGGALWGGLAGWLKVRYRASEVVVTIMLNYVALYLSRMILLRLPGGNSYQTAVFPDTALLANPLLRSISSGSRLNLGIFLLLLALFFYHTVLRNSVLGLRIRIVGFNADAAHANGINVGYHRFWAMFIAGAFAGLAGAITILGSFDRGQIMTAMDGTGFAGITVALMGAATTIGIFFAGLFFAALNNARPLLQINNVPRDTIDLIFGLTVFLLAFRFKLQQFLASSAAKWLRRA